MTPALSKAEGRRTWQRLGTAFDPRNNSLGFLRFMLAALVIVNHAYPLGGFNGGIDPMNSWSRGQETFGGIAVGAFFVISGFLITRSFASSRSVRNFVWRRFLRIFPGFWVCLLVTAAVFGSVAWHVERGTFDGYLASTPSPFDYVRRNFWITMNQYDIGGLLAATPFGQRAGPAFNGSLWTLVYEVKCYIGLAVVGALGLVRRGRAALLALTAGLWLVALAEAVTPGNAEKLWGTFADPYLLRLPLLFCLGMVLYLYRDAVPMSGVLAGVAAALIVVSVPLRMYHAIGYLGFAYLWMWLAVRLPFRRFADRGDFSYGLYIYAFPVQQFGALMGWHRFGIVPYILGALAVSLVLAVASWFLVEQPALKLKDGIRLRRRPAAPPPPAAVPATVVPTTVVVDAEEGREGDRLPVPADPAPVVPGTFIVPAGAAGPVSSPRWGPQPRPGRT